MRHRFPFQKLCYCQADEITRREAVLLAASGPTVVSYNAAGKRLSSWPSSQDELTDEELSAENSENVGNGDRPSKRRRIDDRQSVSRQESDASDVSLEIAIERKKGERRKTKILDTKLPNVSHIICSRTGSYVVLVTAEDKSVKVMRLRPSGRLELVIARNLPKRLCAIKLTEDESTILAADKFGDVYALPLIPSTDYVPPQVRKPAEATDEPSATELTVHTKGNREALRQQREHKQKQPKKDGLNFEHKIILGHVSLLTDLVIAEGPVKGVQRPFIITADRDEHIRVSRGIPQAHIIENYCLGHTEFISKLRILPWRKDLLIAGNGEPSLRIFDWQNGKQQQIVHMVDYLNEIQTDGIILSGRQPDKLAISGLWPYSIKDSSSEVCNRLIVALEGVSMLFIFIFTGGTVEGAPACVQLPGNALDVAQVDDGIVVSVDILHDTNSVGRFRDENHHPIPALIRLRTGDLSNNENNAHPQIIPFTHDMDGDLLEPIMDDLKISTEGKGRERLYSDIGEFLYGLENLRKKKDSGPEDDVDTTHTSALDQAGELE